MAIIQSIPISGSGGSGSTYTNMTTDEAIAGTNTEERVISAKVLNDAIDNKIPTVNNGTLTIQKNGTTVKTFTANASKNVTANITVPTKVSDLTNDSNFLTSTDILNKADKATTLSGYGITDAYTKTQVDKKVADLVNSAPETLDTLNELASALGNDPNFATTVATQIGTKANDSDVVHKNGDETIGGNKTFSHTPTVTRQDVGTAGYNVKRGFKRGSEIAATSHSTFRVVDSDDDIISEVCTENYADGKVSQILNVRNTNNDGTQVQSSILHLLDKTGEQDWVVPSQDNKTYLGTLTNRWANVKTVLLNDKTPAYADDLTPKANDSDVVHKNGDETIAGVKTFNDRMFLKSSTFERGNLPSTNVNEDREFELLDKNNRRIFSIFNYYFTNGNGKSVMYAYNPNTTNHDLIGISFDFDNINSQKSFVPNVNDAYNLGSSSLKWKDVYATTFNGNLVGNADTATKATNNASGNELSNNIIKGLSVSGKVITYTKLDGSTETITTQDTNTWTAFKGATSSTNGTAGYVPAPTKGNQNKFFRADGTWATPTNTTYSVATTSSNGLMSSTDKTKLDGLSNYTLPTASSELGGVKTTSTVTSTSGLTACPIIKGVPYYKDTNTTYSAMSAAEATTGTATTARSISAKVLNDKIDEKISALVASAPEALDTLNELASALGNDPNFATAMSTEIGKKLDTTTASSTYVAKSEGIVGLSVSGKVITYTKGDGSTGTITTQDTNTDTKVTNTLGNTTKAYITGTTSAKTNTGTQIFDTGVYLTTTAGQLHADIDFPITEAQVNEILGIS